MPRKSDSEISDFIKKRPPIGNPVSTGRGANEPLTAAKPRGDAQPVPTSVSRKPIMRPPPPSVKPGDEAKRPIQRTTQDDIQRPVTSPSVTDSAAPGAPATPVPTAPDGKPRPIAPVADSQKPGSPGAPAVGEEKPLAATTGPGEATSTGIEQADQVAQIAATPIEGQELPGSGLAQGPPGEGVPLNSTGQPMTAQEQHGQLQGEFQVLRGDTSGFLSGMDAQRAQDDMRRSQPSKIPAIPQGTYESVVKDRYPEFEKKGQPLSARAHAAMKENAHKQLEEFGDWPGKGDPKAPPPPIRPGGRSFNPFSGKFTGERGPNAFTLMGFDMEKAKSEYFSTGGRGSQ